MPCSGSLCRQAAELLLQAAAALPGARLSDVVGPMHTMRMQPAHRHRRAAQGAADALQITLLSSRVQRILFPDLQPGKCP